MLKLTNHSDYAEPAKKYLRQVLENQPGTPPQSASPMASTACSSRLSDSSREPRITPFDRPIRERRAFRRSASDRRPRPLARSAAIPRRANPRARSRPAVIEDIQIKSELARYRIRGFGFASAPDLGDLRRPHVHPRHAHAHPAGRLSRGLRYPHACSALGSRPDRSSSRYPSW